MDSDTNFLKVRKLDKNGTYDHFPAPIGIPYADERPQGRSQCHLAEDLGPNSGTSEDQAPISCISDVERPTSGNACWRTSCSF